MSNYFILFLTAFSLMIFSAPSEAAVIAVDSDFNTLHVGDVFTIDLFIDTEGQTLNAVEAELFFPNNLIEYIGSEEGESIISLWIEKITHPSPSQLVFSGITPGGFSNKKSPVLSLSFRVKNVGQGNIEIKNAKLLLHDGLGTESKVTKQNLHISVSEGESEITYNAVDDEMPESFTPEVIQDADVFEGAYALIFATEDKGSGIDHFEIKEGFFSTYTLAESPYKLKYQSLDQKIYIKAIDKLGNQRVEIFYPQNWQPWNKQTGLIVSILMLCVLTFLISRRFVRSLLRK